LVAMGSARDEPGDESGPRRVLDSRQRGAGPWTVKTGLVAVTAVLPTAGMGLRVAPCGGVANTGRLVASFAPGRISSTVLAVPDQSCVSVDGDGAVLIDRLAQPDNATVLAGTLWSGRLEPPARATIDSTVADDSLLLVRLDVSPTKQVGAARLGICGGPKPDFELATSRAQLRTGSVLLAAGPARCLSADVGVFGRLVADAVVPGRLVVRQQVFNSHRR
jgi:hypothetical protein